jgi:hypothetical protein
MQTPLLKKPQMSSGSSMTDFYGLSFAYIFAPRIHRSALRVGN